MKKIQTKSLFDQVRTGGRDNGYTRVYRLKSPRFSSTDGIKKGPNCQKIPEEVLLCSSRGHATMKPEDQIRIMRKWNSYKGHFKSSIY